MGITAQDAKKRLKGRALKPLEPFPGVGSLPWALSCDLCGKETQESLHKLEKRSRPGCADCCSKSQNRISDKDALSRLAEKQLVPLEKYPGTIGAKWKIKCGLCGDESTTTLNLLASRVYSGCADCGLKAVKLEGAVTPKQALGRLVKLGLEPLEPYPGHTKTPWRCRCKNCGTEIIKPLNHMEYGSACSTCSGQERSKAFAAAAVKELREAGFAPLVPFPGNEVGWQSRCLTCGETSLPIINSLRYQNTGCQFCTQKKRVKAANAQTLPEAMQLLTKALFVPIGSYQGFDKPWKAKCLTCGRTSSPTPKYIKKQGSACRYCAKNAPWTLRHANSVARQANRKFLEEFKGVVKPILMECLRCGNIAKGKPGSLKDSKGYCQRCKPTAEWTPEKAVQILRAANLEPLEPFRSATAKWRAKCNVCGTEGTPQVTNIASGQGGCKVCGNFGFDVNKPTTLYVLYNRNLGVVKVGITNTGSTRLRTLASVGFVPGKLYEFPEGSEPLEIETNLLRHIKKDLGLKQALSKADMRGAGGATETFWSDELPPQRIHSRIKALRQT
jgi:hypothetical protein